MVQCSIYLHWWNSLFLFRPTIAPLHPFMPFSAFMHLHPSAPFLHFVPLLQSPNPSHPLYLCTFTHLHSLLCDAINLDGGDWEDSSRLKIRPLLRKWQAKFLGEKGAKSKKDVTQCPKGKRVQRLVQKSILLTLCAFALAFVLPSMFFLHCAFALVFAQFSSFLPLHPSHPFTHNTEHYC